MFAPQNPPSKTDPTLARYLFSEFQRIIDLARRIVTNAVARGYGGLYGSGAPAGGVIGGGSWITLQQLQNAMLTDPYDVEQNTGIPALVIERRGIWLLDLHVAWSHTAVGAARTCEVQIAKGTSSLTTVYQGTAYTGSNETGTDFTATIMAEIDESEVGETLRVRIGGGTSSLYNGVTFYNNTFSAHHISEVIL